MFERVVTGTVEGTGSAIDVAIGFVPVAVFYINIDGGADLAMGFWWDSMGAGKILKLDLTGPAITFESSNGITALEEDVTVSASDTTSDGDATSFSGDRGFTIGADTDINVSAETIAYVAIR